MYEGCVTVALEVTTTTRLESGIAILVRVKRKMIALIILSRSILPMLDYFISFMSVRA